jgi:hypothetical protein
MDIHGQNPLILAPILNAAKAPKQSILKGLFIHESGEAGKLQIEQDAIFKLIDDVNDDLTLDNSMGFAKQDNSSFSKLNINRNRNIFGAKKGVTESAALAMVAICCKLDSGIFNGLNGGKDENKLAIWLLTLFPVINDKQLKQVIAYFVDMVIDSDNNILKSSTKNQAYSINVDQSFSTDNLIGVEIRKELDLTQLPIIRIVKYITLTDGDKISSIEYMPEKNCKSIGTAADGGYAQAYFNKWAILVGYRIAGEAGVDSLATSAESSVVSANSYLGSFNDSVDIRGKKIDPILKNFIMVLNAANLRQYHSISMENPTTKLSHYNQLNKAFREEGKFYDVKNDVSGAIVDTTMTAYTKSNSSVCRNININSDKQGGLLGVDVDPESVLGVDAKEVLNPVNSFITAFTVDINVDKKKKFDGLNIYSSGAFGNTSLFDLDGLKFSLNILNRTYSLVKSSGDINNEAYNEISAYRGCLPEMLDKRLIEGFANKYKNETFWGANATKPVEFQNLPKEFQKAIKAEINKAQAKTFLDEVLDSAADNNKDKKKICMVGTKILRNGHEKKVYNQHVAAMTAATNELSTEKREIKYYAHSVNVHADGIFKRYWNWLSSIFRLKSESLPRDCDTESIHSQSGHVKFGYLSNYKTHINNMKPSQGKFCDTMLSDLINLLKDTNVRRHAIPIATLHTLLVSFLNNPENYVTPADADTHFVYTLDCKTAKDRTTSVLAGVKALMPIMLRRYVIYGNDPTKLSLANVLDVENRLDWNKLDRAERTIIRKSIDPKMFTVGNENMYGIPTNISTGVFESSFFANVPFIKALMADIKVSKVST